MNKKKTKRTLQSTRLLRFTVVVDYQDIVVVFPCFYARFTLLTQWIWGVPLGNTDFLEIAVGRSYTPLVSSMRRRVFEEPAPQPSFRNGTELSSLEYESIDAPSLGYSDPHVGQS